MCICCDDAAGDGGEDVFHVGLHLADLTDTATEIGEEPCVVDGNCRLVTECRQEVKVRVVEELRRRAAIDVDHTERATTDTHRRTHERADAECDDAMMLA